MLSLEDRFHFLLRYFDYFHDKLHVKNLTVYPNKTSKLVSPIIRLLRGENYTSSEHISHVLNPTKVWYHGLSFMIVALSMNPVPIRFCSISLYSIQDFEIVVPIIMCSSLVDLGRLCSACGHDVIVHSAWFGIGGTARNY